VLTNFATSAGDPQPPNFLIFLAIALSLYQYKAFRFVGERSIRFTDRERERVENGAEEVPSGGGEGEGGQGWEAFDRTGLPEPFREGRVSGAD
jgi:hypothetical protein